MTQELTELDLLLLDRWIDTSSLRDAIKELERRMSDRLEAVAESLEPWFHSRGYSLLSVDNPYASIHIAKSTWLKKSKDDAWMTVSVGALYPYGFRRVEDEHPYVWLHSGDLPKAERQVFQLHMSGRLKGHADGWLNDQCEVDAPIGRFLTTHGDIERVKLAKSEDDLAAFVRSSFESIFELEAEIDEGFKAVRER